MRVLKRAIFREMRLQFIASCSLFALGLTVCYVFADSSLLLVVLGTGISAIGLVQVIRTFRVLYRASSPLLYILREAPDHIVWVYSVVTERSPFGFTFMRQGTMYFKLADGDEISVLMHARKLKLVSRFLNRLLPHASFGYSTDREQLFEISPEQLRKKE